VHQALSAKDELLADLVLKLVTNVRYKFTELMPEQELFIADNEKRVIIRKGLPQGLSISPLLCTLAVEQFKPPKGTFMYVDDGVFIGDEEGFSEFFMFIQEIMYAGAFLAPEKSGYVEDSFQFLGCEINLKRSYIKLMDGYKVKIKTETPVEAIQAEVVKHNSQIYLPQEEKS